MAAISLPQVTEDMTQEELIMTVGKMNKLLQYIMYNLDSMNIKSLTADKISAGTIDANLITITNLVVGGNVTMGPDAVITWGNLPEDVANVGDIEPVPGYIHETYISSTLIQSPTIQAGTLEGVFLDTTEDAYIGDTLYMGDTTGVKQIRFNLGSVISSQLDSYGTYQKMKLSAKEMEIESLYGLSITGVVLFNDDVVFSDYVDFDNNVYFNDYVDFRSAGTVWGVPRSSQKILFQVYDGRLEFKLDGGTYEAVALLSDLP